MANSKVLLRYSMVLKGVSMLFGMLAFLYGGVVIVTGVDFGGSVARETILYASVAVFIGLGYMIPNAYVASGKVKVRAYCIFIVLCVLVFLSILLNSIQGSVVILTTIVVYGVISVLSLLPLVSLYLYLKGMELQNQNENYEKYEKEMYL